MIADVTKHIKSARRSGLALRAVRWAFFHPQNFTGAGIHPLGQLMAWPYLRGLT